MCIHHVLLSLSTPSLQHQVCKPWSFHSAGQSAYLLGVAGGLSSSAHHLSHPLPIHTATSFCGQTITQTLTSVQGSSPVRPATFCQALAALQVRSFRYDSSFGSSSSPSSSSCAWPRSYCCLMHFKGTARVSPASPPTTSKSPEFCKQRLIIE